MGGIDLSNWDYSDDGAIVGLRNEDSINPGD
jgi:hypothetical protein